ncbi:uncharacterized protein YpmS [Salirhabdus euzebyi]|uniref:Uncharacterized protein YpmS n=1 Tax=Salirhabdus euzebyi TaxID=394506 RepID=A0A841Q5E5_9BACI|nr:hypothetical protein [Salirhabdus euzebyi]MBB6453689.1 uncharacterized protein YpmS [Salirhabdus euzebyi]
MKKLTLLLSSLILLLVLAACTETIETKSSSQDPYVSIVTEGNFYDYPNDYVGRSFNDFFSAPKWEYFLSEEDEHIVEFNGKAEYMGDTVNVCIQFGVDPVTEEFEVVWSDIDEYEMSDWEFEDLMYTVFE